MQDHVRLSLAELDKHIENLNDVRVTLQRIFDGDRLFPVSPAPAAAEREASLRLVTKRRSNTPRSSAPRVRQIKPDANTDGDVTTVAGAFRAIIAGLGKTEFSNATIMDTATAQYPFMRRKIATSTGQNLRSLEKQGEIKSVRPDGRGHIWIALKKATPSTTQALHDEIHRELAKPVED